MFGPALPPKPTSEAPKLHKKSKRDSYKHKTKKKASLASKRNSQEIGENGTATSAATTSLEEQRKSSFSYEDVVKSKWNTPSPHGHGFATIEEGESTSIADNKVAECERLDIAAEQVQDFHYNKTSKLSSSAKSGRKRKKRHRQRKTSQSASSNSSLVTPTKPKYPRRQMSNSPSNSSSSSNPKSQILSQTWQPSRSPTAERNLSGMHEQELEPETCESQPESETHEDVDSEAKGVCRSEDIKGRHRKKNTDSGKPVLMWQPPLEFGEEEEFVHEHIKKHKNSSKSKMKSRSKDANDVSSPTNDKEALHDKGQIINQEAPAMPTHVETDKSNFETTNKHHNKEENNSTVPPLVKTPSNNDELDEMLFSALEMSPIGRTSDHSKAKTLLQIDARKRTISELRKKLEKEKPREETATESGGNAGSMKKKAAESAQPDQQSAGVATAAARTPSLLRFGVMSKYVAPTRPKIDTQEDVRAEAAKVKDVESIWSDDDVTNGESVGTGAKKPVPLLDQRRPNSVEAAVSDRKTPPVNLPADRVSTRVEAKDEVASEMHTRDGDGDDDDDDVDDTELRVSVPVEKKPIIFNIKLTKASAEETKSVHKASAKKSKKKKAKKKLEKKLKRHKAKEAKDVEKAAPATACPDTSTTSTTTTSATSSVSVPASSIGETAAAAAAANATSPTDAQYRARLPHYPPFYPMPPMNYAGSPAPPNMPPSLYQHMYYQHFFAYQHQQNLRAAQQLQSGELPLLLPPFPHPPPPPLPCEDAPAKPPEPKKAFKSVSDYEVMNLFKLRDITQESVEKAWRKEKQELPELPSPPSSRASSRSDRRTRRRGRRRSSDVSRRRSSYSSRSSSRGSPRRSRRSRSRTRSYTSSSRSSYYRRSRYSSRRRRRRSGRRSRRRSYSTGSSSSYYSSDRSRSRSRSSRSSRRTRSASSATFRSSSAWSTSSSGSDIERPCRHYKSSSGARRSDKAEPSRGRSLTSPQTNKSRWSSDSSYSSDDRRRKSREKSWSDVSHDRSTDSD